MLTRNRLTSHSLSEIDQQGSFKNAVISVGKDFQAKLPSLEKGNPSYKIQKRKYEVMLWNPNLIKSHEKLQEIISNARIHYKFLNNFEIILMILFRYTEEMTLGLIKWHKGDFDAVQNDLANYTPKRDFWNTDDRAKFFMALDTHNKNFNLIKELFPRKTIGQLVSAYYLFKKNVNVLRDMNVLLYPGAPMGSSILRKVKKFENVMPKHFVSKFGAIIRSLPLSNNSSICLSKQSSWNDHEMAEPVKHIMRKIEINQNIHCVSRLSEQAKDLFFDQGKFSSRKVQKRSHQCTSEHKRWLRDFYRSYSHQELIQHLQATDDIKVDSINQEIVDSNNLIKTLESDVMNKSKQLIDQLKQFKQQLPQFNSKWKEEDIQLAQLAIKEAGGDIKFVKSALGYKSVNMVKHFISLYSQRLQIDEEIWQNLLSNSMTKA